MGDSHVVWCAAAALKASNTLTARSLRGPWGAWNSVTTRLALGTVTGICNTRTCWMSIFRGGGVHQGSVGKRVCVGAKFSSPGFIHPHGWSPTLMDSLWGLFLIFLNFQWCFNASMVKVVLVPPIRPYLLRIRTMLFIYTQPATIN